MTNDEINDLGREYSRLQSDPDYQERIRIGMEILNHAKSKAANVPRPAASKLRKKPKPPSPVSPRMSCFPELTKGKPEPARNVMVVPRITKLEKLRKKCALSYERLAEETGVMNEKTVRGHCKGKPMRAASMKLYIDVFTRLGCKLTVADLQT